MKNTPPSAQTECITELDIFMSEIGLDGEQMDDMRNYICEIIIPSERTRLLSVESMKQESLEDITEFTHIKIIQARNGLRQSILSEMEKGGDK